MTLETLNRITAIGLALAVGLAAPLAADSHTDPDAAFFETWTQDFKRSCDKLVSLAEAMPQETYGWRPMDGVRSVSENFMHVANANLFFSGVLGAERPEGLPEDLEAVTDKAEAVKLLKTSIEAVHAAVEKLSGMDLDGEKTELFGNEFTKRQILFILGGHAHEHLGQAIAYARSNQVVPPWSVPRQAEPTEEGGEGQG